MLYVWTLEAQKQNPIDVARSSELPRRTKIGAAKLGLSSDEILLLPGHHL
jgi:hypothetical protein